MSDLLSRLKAGRAAIGSVTVDGVAFGLRLLSEQDYLAAQIATEVAMREAGLELSISTAEAYEAEKSSQLLARALVDPVTAVPVAANAQALREAVGREQLSAMVNAYLAHEKVYSPSARTLSNDELTALVDEVKKSPETTLSSVSSIDTLKRLITILASPPAS
ncbi:hypothetical protein ABWL39_20540 [Chitinivorax sp. PXF-14]|uniref:hypothetical protein n=1 Tax=Chitinivorax sp. PXF-14 TaxID=3230488 RepID=UPI003465D570